MVNWNWLPGSGLLRQAWDATKLVGAILDRRQQQAVVLRQETEQRMTPFRGKNATKKVKEVFEDKNAEEFAKLFVPEAAVTFVQTAKDVYWKIWDLYWCLAILRIFLVFLPQSGYIHPDEFFQTVEVVSGDVLRIDSTRTWEFNSTSPVRSMVLPTLLYGLPLYVLKALDGGLLHYVGVSGIAVSPYLVLLLPRLVMLALSFVIDYCVYQICIIYQHSYNRCLTTLASSYVMLVYATRTFTNSIEMVLATVLVYLVAHCMKRTSETVYLQSMVQQAYDKAESTKERVQLKKKKKLIPEHDFKHFLPISVICAVGIFNRPTFLAYCCIPLFYWFQRGIATDSYFTPFVIFHFRMVSLIPGFLVTSLLFILLDSLYYGDLTLLKLWELDMSWSDWKCTPLQFIMYNVVPGNLDQHGSHPFYTHALVNLPLLFGPLGLCALWSSMNFFAKMIHNEWNYKPGVRTVYALTMFTFIAALALLSVFPHQEPRFLIPLSVPIVLMNAHHLRYKIRGHKPLLILWYAFNILLGIFYGCIHQGGVTPTVRFFASDLRVQTDTSEVNIVFSNTYMPPKFPLLQGRRGEAAPPYIANPKLRFIYHDMAGASLEKVKDKLVTLVSRARYLHSVKSQETYVVLPTHLIRELGAESKNDLTFRAVHSHSPHLSTENLPEFDLDLLVESISGPIHRLPTLLLDFVQPLAHFSLTVYKVDIGDVHTVEMKTNRAASA